MLRLFSSIRKTLILRRQGSEGHVNEGKASRYVRYAVGEFVLIVAGILVALQIQNWNEERLNRIEERLLLIELMDNLDQEARQLELGSSVLNNLVESLVAIRQYFEGNSTDQNKFESDLGRIHHSFRFTPATSAYETMKGSGKGFSNRDLKARLFQYYHNGQPLLIGILDRRRNQIINQLQPLLSQHLKSLDLDPWRAVPKNINDPKFREDILGQLIYLLPDTQITLERCTSLIGTNREIRAFVEAELNN